MSEQMMELVVIINEAASPEWFVEFVHDGRVKQLRAKIGDRISVPAGAWVSRYGPVEIPEAKISLGSVSVSPA